MNINTEKVFPGDRITALGYTFTVWSILYQDHLCGSYDVEFIDDHDRYHHWKQECDGGNVIREGEPAKYFSETSGACGSDIIARIKPRKNGRPGVVAEILRLHGADVWLGSFSSEESAMAAIESYSATHRLAWREM